MDGERDEEEEDAPPGPPNPPPPAADIMIGGELGESGPPRCVKRDPGDRQKERDAVYGVHTLLPGWADTAALLRRHCCPS